MNRHVNAIAGRLSLRPPQRRSLELLDRITEIAPPKKGADAAAAYAKVTLYLAVVLGSGVLAYYGLRKMFGES